MAILEVAPDGRLRRETSFDPAELDLALAELAARAQRGPPPNRAWESIVAAWESFDRRDWDGWVAHHLPEQVQEHRQHGNVHVLVGSEVFRTHRVMWAMDELEVGRRLVATEGDRVALVRMEVRGSDGAVGDMEYVSLNVVEVDEDGRIARQISFDPEDTDLAVELLHELGR